MAAVARMPFDTVLPDLYSENGFRVTGALIDLAIDGHAC
jgi:hypothetical protein